MRPVLLSALLATTAHAQSAGDVVVSTRSIPSFKNPTPALQSYIEHYAPKARGLQHFCIVAYRSPDDDQRAYVVWREGREIILWSEAADPKYAEHLLVFSRRVWDLDKDVVPTAADLHHSTYLVTAAWVRDIQRACERGGTSIELFRR